MASSSPSSPPSSLDREKAVYSAKLAEEAERYEDMAKNMKRVAKMGVELTIEERILLSRAYQKMVWSRRDVLKKSRPKADWKKYIVRDIPPSNYRISSVETKVKAEIKDICRDILCIIDDCLIPSCTPQDHTNRVLYLMMKGDFYKYVGELRGPGWIEAAQQSLDAYEAARIIARAQFSPAHPVRVSLELNYSVFYYTFDCSPERAIEITNEALNEANSGLDSLNEEAYKDVTKIMKILRDNITYWERLNKRRFRQFI